MILFACDAMGPGGVVRDAGRADVRDAPTDVFDANRIGYACTADDHCGGVGLCLAGICQEDPCVRQSPCGETTRCLTECVDIEDRCAGVTCRENETCLRGRCIPGCFATTCAGVVCATGMYCDRQRGECTPLRACDAECGDGEACHMRCIPRDPCDGITCSATQVCFEGACIENPCIGRACGPTETCVNGTCVDTCRCEPPCTRGENDRCVGGRCVCVPDCTGKYCGEPDGCGGNCGGLCPAKEFHCHDSTRTCVCEPRCAAGACGGDDGCGGICGGNCPSALPCGTSMPSACGTGACLGTACEAGHDCDLARGVCVCRSSCSPTAACGTSDGCGRECAGTCRAGLGCAAVSGRPGDFECVPSTCDPPCACGLSCVAGSCIPLCAAGETLCNCNLCCPVGLRCDSALGACVPFV